MKKISGCGSLKFEDLGQGNKDTLCRGQSLAMNGPGWWWWYGKIGGGVNHCQ